MHPLTRRLLLQASAGTALSWTVAGGPARAVSPPPGVLGQIDRRHDESIQRLRAWIAEPCIAAEQKGYDTGLPFFLGMLREAGFQKVERVPTRGLPGVFATLDAGAARTLAVYFMYDVKQADPAEWSSPTRARRSRSSRMRRSRAARRPCTTAPTARRRGPRSS